MLLWRESKILDSEVHNLKSDPKVPSTIIDDLQFTYGNFHTTIKQKKKVAKISQRVFFIEQNV